MKPQDVVHALAGSTTITIRYEYSQRARFVLLGEASHGTEEF